MEATISNILLLGSPILAVAVFLLARGRWLEWAAIVAAYIALLCYFSAANWGGPGDAVVGRGITVILSLGALLLTGLASLFVMIGRLGKRNRDEAGEPREKV